MAECQNETDEPEANVLVHLNKVRQREDVLMPDYPTVNWPTATKDQRRKAIIHERRIELCGEAIRDMDILRWRKHGKLDYEPIPYFVLNKHELLPLPQTEINNNPMIQASDQNAGY